MGLGGAEDAEGSGKATVVTPIFCRERSSVMEIEREIAGRGTASRPEKDKDRDF